MRCAACGARHGEWCPRAATSSRRHVVIIAGRFASMFRDGAGFAVQFEEPGLPPFRALGTPGQVLALAEEHIRTMRRELHDRDGN